MKTGLSERLRILIDQAKASGLSQAAFHRELRPRRGEPGYTTTTGWTRGRRALLTEHEALAAFDDHLATAREFADDEHDLRCSHVELLRLVPADRPLLELLAAALEAPFDHHLDRGAWWADLALARAWYGIADPAARKPRP